MDVLSERLAVMNAVLRKRNAEINVGNVEATDVRIDALRAGLDEVKKDIREFRADFRSLVDKIDRIHGEMHAGFAAMRESIADLRATMRTMFWAVGIVGTLAMVFLTAGRALHWFDARF
jgi:hypothetical protein